MRSEESTPGKTLRSSLPSWESPSPESTRGARNFHRRRELRTLAEEAREELAGSRPLSAELRHLTRRELGKHRRNRK